MRLLTALCLVSAVVLLSACGGVVVDRPIGGEPAALLPAEVNGVWYFPRDKKAKPFFVRAIGNGVLLFAAIDEAGEDFRMEKFRLHVRSAGGELYLSAPTDDELPKGYFFARVARKDKDRWILWPPKLETFKAAVSSGRLKGKVSGRGHFTVVEVDHEAAMAFVQATPGGELWSEEDAIVVRRFDPRAAGKSAAE